MPQTTILLLIAFIESFVTILDERSVYFFCKERLGFSAAENLWLALAFGSGYVFAAWRAHWLASRIGARRQLAIVIAVLIGVHAWLFFFVSAPVMYVAMVLLGLANGAKWPVLEGFLGGGLAPAQTARVMGRFNIAWSSAVPLALASTGPLIGIHPTALFIAGGVGSLVSLGLCGFLPTDPAPPLPAAPNSARHEHPEHLAGLLVASRWLMLAAYISVFVFAPLAPGIFERLNCPTEWAPAASGLLDAMRLAAFVTLGLWTGWRGRARWQILAMIALPLGFFMVILGASLPVVIVGEMLFGLAAGLSYSSAMYCAMVVKDASVDAGGGHELMIGFGLMIGPLAGLAGDWIKTAADSQPTGYVTAMAPLLGVCIIAAIYSIYKRPAPET